MFGPCGFARTIKRGRPRRFKTEGPAGERRGQDKEMEDSLARARYEFDTWLFNDRIERWWEFTRAYQLENLEGLA